MFMGNYPTKRAELKHYVYLHLNSFYYIQIFISETLSCLSAVVVVRKTNEK